MYRSKGRQRVLDTMITRAVGGFVVGVSFPELAKGAGVSLRSLPRHITNLEMTGYLRRFVNRGRGCINTYFISEAE